MSDEAAYSKPSRKRMCLTQAEKKTKRSKPPAARTAKYTSAAGNAAKDGHSATTKKRAKTLARTSLAEVSVEEETKARKRKALNKKEKLTVINRVKELNSGALTVATMAAVCNQMPLSNEELKQFCISLPVNAVKFLAEHLKNLLVYMKKVPLHLKLQQKWYQHYSYFLVDCNCDLTLLDLHPSDPIAAGVVSVRSCWHNLVAQHSLTKPDGKNFLILFCSSVFDELLYTCHATIEDSQDTTEPSVQESDDVYY